MFTFFKRKDLLMYLQLLFFTGEDLKTERELPPMMLGSDFRCKNFSFANHYFHLHGGLSLAFTLPTYYSLYKCLLVNHDVENSISRVIKKSNKHETLKYYT